LQEPLRESVVAEAKPAVRIVGGEGHQLSGDGVLEFPGFVLISVALDTAALRAGSDSRTLTVSFPTPAISNKRCLTLSLIIRP
jgi:hypothetical protein